MVFGRRDAAGLWLAAFFALTGGMSATLMGCSGQSGLLNSNASTIDLVKLTAGFPQCDELRTGSANQEPTGWTPPGSAPDFCSFDPNTTFRAALGQTANQNACSVCAAAINEAFGTKLHCSAIDIGKATTICTDCCATDCTGGTAGCGAAAGCMCCAGHPDTCPCTTCTITTDVSGYGLSSRSCSSDILKINAFCLEREYCFPECSPGTFADNTTHTCPCSVEYLSRTILDPLNAKIIRLVPARSTLPEGTVLSWECLSAVGLPASASATCASDEGWVLDPAASTAPCDVCSVSSLSTTNLLPNAAELAAPWSDNVTDGVPNNATLGWECADRGGPVITGQASCAASGWEFSSEEPTVCSLCSFTSLKSTISANAAVLAASWADNVTGGVPKSTTLEWQCADLGGPVITGQASCAASGWEFSPEEPTVCSACPPVSTLVSKTLSPSGARLSTPWSGSTADMPIGSNVSWQCNSMNPMSLPPGAAVCTGSGWTFYPPLGGYYTGNYTPGQCLPPSFPTCSVRGVALATSAAGCDAVATIMSRCTGEEVLCREGTTGSGADGLFVAYTKTPNACTAVASALIRLANLSAGDIGCGSRFGAIPNAIQVGGSPPSCAPGLPALNAWLATTPNASTCFSTTTTTTPASAHHPATTTPASIHHTAGWDVGITIGIVVLGVGLVSLGYFGVTQWRRRHQQDEVDEQEMGLISENKDGAKESWRISHDDLKFGKKLGDGANGEVFTAKWHGTDVAVKMLSAGSLVAPLQDGTTVLQATQNSSEFDKEVQTLSAIRHPNLCSYFGFGIKSPLDDPQPFLVIEMMRGGSLRELLMSGAAMEWDVRIEYLIGTAAGMAYLHNCDPPLVHRDLKSDNILLDGKNFGRGSVKVADFGTASRIRPNKALMDVDGSQMVQSKTLGVGTPMWMAPEVFSGKHGVATYSTKVDVYSFGIVLFEVLAREEPFAEIKSIPLHEFQAMVSKGRRPVVPQTCVGPEGFVMTMERCWDATPQFRPTFQDLLDVLQSMNEDI